MENVCGCWVIKHTSAGLRTCYVDSSLVQSQLRVCFSCCWRLCREGGAGRMTGVEAVTRATASFGSRSTPGRNEAVKMKRRELEQACLSNDTEWKNVLGLSQIITRLSYSIILSEMNRNLRPFKLCLKLSTTSCRGCLGGSAECCTFFTICTFVGRRSTRKLTRTAFVCQF